MCIAAASVTGGVNRGIVSFKSTSFYEPLVVQEERRKEEEGKKKKKRANERRERERKKKRETFHETREGELERFYGGVYFRILRSSP